MYRMVVYMMHKVDELFAADNNTTEIQVVKKAIKETKDKRMYQRYLVILYHLRGYINKDIAKMVNLCQHTVGTYINKYKEHSLQGLALGHSPGAPCMLTKEQEEKLVELITTKTPDEVGFPPRKNWTVAIIRQWVIENFGVAYSPRGMAEVLYRLNLSYTRPTYTLAKADQKKQEDFKQEFKVLKKSS